MTFRRGEWFGIAGIGLTLLLGLPGTVALYKGESVGAAVLSGLLVLCIIALVSGLYIVSRLPKWTVVSHRAELSCKDDQGKHAVYRKTLRIRANRRGLEHYIHRNISSDGPLKNFRVEGHSKILSQEIDAGDYSLTVRLEKPLAFGEIVETWLECDCEDAFLDDPEEFVLQVDQPQRCAEVVVSLPKNRPATRAIALYRYVGGTKGAHWQPEIRNGRVEWKCPARFLRRVPYGDFIIRWYWPHPQSP